MAPNNSTAGVLLDLLFALCLFDLRGKPLNTIPCFQLIPEIQDETIQVDNIVRWDQNNMTPQPSLSSLMATHRGLFLPKHFSRPDVIYISPSVLIITGNKTNSVQAVKKAEIIDNFNTTNINTIFSAGSEERETILANIYHYPPRVIVRIHNILPHPPPLKGIYSVFNYSEKIIKLKNTTIPPPPIPPPTLPFKKKKVENSTPTNDICIPTYAINLNFFNIESSGLFSPFVAQKLCLLYPPTHSFKNDPKQKITSIISEETLNKLEEEKRIADEAKRLQEEKERKERQAQRKKQRAGKGESKQTSIDPKKQEKMTGDDDQSKKQKKKKEKEKEKKKEKKKEKEKVTDDDSDQSSEKQKKKKKEKEKVTDYDSDQSSEKQKKKKKVIVISDDSDDIDNGDDSENSINNKSKTNPKKRTK